MKDVIAVSIKMSTVRVIAENQTEKEAEEIEKAAVKRRGHGVETEFFSVEDHGKYKSGDHWIWP